MNGLRPASTPADDGDDAPYTLALVRQALQIADAAVIADIETEGTRVGYPHERRWCVAAMFDEHERASQTIDMAEAGIAYGVARGLLVIEPGAHWLVRITRGLAQ